MAVWADEASPSQDGGLEVGVVGEDLLHQQHAYAGMEGGEVLCVGFGDFLSLVWIDGGRAAKDEFGGSCCQGESGCLDELTAVGGVAAARGYGHDDDVGGWDLGAFFFQAQELGLDALVLEGLKSFIFGDCTCHGVACFLKGDGQWKAEPSGSDDGDPTVLHGAKVR